MNKRELSAHFDGKIAPRCFRHDGYEWGITGRYCRITQADAGLWDLWLCNPQNIAEGLGQRRLNRIIAHLSQKMPVTASFTVLTGEAYTQAATTELILTNLPLLGIFRKRTINEKQRRVLAAHAIQGRVA